MNFDLFLVKTIIPANEMKSQPTKYEGEYLEKNFSLKNMPGLNSELVHNKKRYCVQSILIGNSSADGNCKRTIYLSKAGGLA